MSEQTCKTHGHIYGHSGQCLFCAAVQSPVAPPTPREQSEPDRIKELLLPTAAPTAPDGSWDSVVAVQWVVEQHDALRVENTRLREALDKSDAEVELLEAYVEDLRNICQRANIDPDAARAALTPQAEP